MRTTFLRRAIFAIGLVLLAAGNLFPVFLIVRQALSPEAESATWPLTLLPEVINAENLQRLWQTESLLEHAALSFWVAGMSTMVALLFGVPAGWAAARFGPVSRVAQRSAAASRILPPIAIAIPLVSILIPLALYNHPMGYGLIVAHVLMGLPIATLVSYASFRDVPPELEEAAHVDGCSPFAAFVRISLPAARGAIGSAAILVFITSWDEFMYALLIQLTNRTLPPLVYYYAEFGQLGAASTLALLMLLPVILVVVALQQLVSRGVFAGALK